MRRRRENFQYYALQKPFFRWDFYVTKGIESLNFVNRFNLLLIAECGFHACGGQDSLAELRSLVPKRFAFASDHFGKKMTNGNFT